MTTTINASTSSGLVNTADTSGILQLQTASTAAVTINASQQVGIGTTSPANILDVAYAQNGSTLVNLTNSNAGASARAGFSSNSDTTQLNVYATSSGYTGVASWTGAGVMSVGSGSTNGLILNCESQPIKFQISRTEAMRITSAGYLNIGADGTTSTLSIAPTVTSRPSTTAPMIQTTGGGGSGVYTNAGQLIISGRPTDTSTYGNIYIQTGATQQNQWTFNNGANLVLPGGTATATGTGITFPATQVASSNANTLDDYEEGTWTVTDGSGAGLSITTTYATYIKVGKLVFINAYFSYPATANATPADIGGLPFTAQSDGYSFLSGRCTNSVGIPISWQVQSSGNDALATFAYTGGNATNANLSSAAILISGCYRAAN